MLTDHQTTQEIQVADHPIQHLVADLLHHTATAALHQALTAVVVHPHQEVVHPTPLDHPLHLVVPAEVHPEVVAEDNHVKSTEL